MERGGPDNVMTDKLVKIEIRDHESLMEACDLLHDAQCDVSGLEVDQTAGCWEAPFEREFFEDPNLIQSRRSLLLFTRYTFPLVSSHLTLRNVATYEIRDRSRIGTYTFDECCLRGDTYELLFCEDMEMVLRFRDKPCGELRDLSLLSRKGSLFGFRTPFRKERSI